MRDSGQKRNSRDLFLLNNFQGLVSFKKIKNMSGQELKSQIQHVLDEMPEEILEDVLLYMESIRNISHQKLQISSNLKKILQEDKELLQKLAKRKIYSQ